MEITDKTPIGFSNGGLYVQTWTFHINLSKTGWEGKLSVLELHWGRQQQDKVLKCDVESPCTWLQYENPTPTGPDCLRDRQRGELALEPLLATELGRNSTPDFLVPVPALTGEECHSRAETQPCPSVDNGLTGWSRANQMASHQVAHGQGWEKKGDLQLRWGHSCCWCWKEVVQAQPQPGSRESN